MWEQWGEGSVTYDAPVVAPIVEIDDLAALLAGGRPVDFIKLDLEGNEINALRGATKTLQAHRPVIVTEFGLKPDNEHLYDETLAGFAGLLDQWGYRAFAPWGEDVTASMVEEYPFWYLFLLPVGETLDTQRQLLEDAFATSLGE